ncbi:MAG: hypothetical protein AB1805_16850 [Nitrospirota bacterium]
MAEQEEAYSEIEHLRIEVKRLREALDTLTPPLEVLLKRRGFRIYKREPRDDLLVPEDRFVGEYYEMLRRYSFRLFLRDVIKHQPSFTTAQVARYATRAVTEAYAAFLVAIGLAVPEDTSYRLARGPVKSFGTTLEWFVAELFKRAFSAEAIWGVKMKRPQVGGDYDLLAKLDGSLLYMEIKSSPPKQIYQREIGAFFDRVRDLMPELALFFVDTELRMKDKIVPLFEEELRGRYASPPAVERMEKELFAIEGAGINLPDLFIINAKDSIEGNIQKVLTCHYRRHR